MKYNVTEGSGCGSLQPGMDVLVARRVRVVAVLVCLIRVPATAGQILVVCWRQALAVP